MDKIKTLCLDVLKNVRFFKIPFGMILEGSVICLAHGKILNQDLDFNSCLPLFISHRMLTKTILMNGSNDNLKIRCEQRGFFLMPNARELRTSF